MKKLSRIFKNKVLVYVFFGLLILSILALVFVFLKHQERLNNTDQPEIEKDVFNTGDTNPIEWEDTLITYEEQEKLLLEMIDKTLGTFEIYSIKDFGSQDSEELLSRGIYDIVKQQAEKITYLPKGKEAIQRYVGDTVYTVDLQDKVVETKAGWADPLSSIFNQLKTQETKITEYKAMMSIVDLDNPGDYPKN
jgi:hypothetical protein